MSEYEPTIGLEIHAHLKTKTKMFCDCLNDPDEKHPNTNICPVCTGHPGVLPTINKKAVETVLRVGLALSGDPAYKSKFDRKNYFYPDLPKGYQISQYDLPLIANGVLSGVRITRIHLEEDAGRLQHAEGKALVDYNRASAPLMELVTEPDIKSAAQAADFARELQLVLRYLRASDADMEKGQMRVEVNVSLGKEGRLGTKVEVKNINSFKAAHDAIEYEIKRQGALLGEGKQITQETRGWDENKGESFPQRSKEEAHDYRYFPEPDLPPLDLSTFDFKGLKRDIPELPQAKRVRFADEYGLDPDTVDLLVSDPAAARFFEESASELASEDKENWKKELKLLTNYLNADLRGLMIEHGVHDFAYIKVNPENFADLIELVAHAKVTSRTAKDILRKMFETGEDPNNILKSEGLEQVSDEGALTETVRKIIEANPDAVADIKKGKTNALQFLVGQAMKELRGKGNPEMLRKLFEDEVA